MDNKTITNFPIIQPKGEVVYNSLGGDNPNFAASWEITYSSSGNIENLTENILDYLGSFRK